MESLDRYLESKQEYKQCWQELQCCTKYKLLASLSGDRNSQEGAILINFNKQKDFLVSLYNDLTEGKLDVESIGKNIGTNGEIIEKIIIDSYIFYENNKNSISSVNKINDDEKNYILENLTKILFFLKDIQDILEDQIDNCSQTQ